jgi:glucose-6-phosphate 1-dehydrogenase
MDLREGVATDRLAGGPGDPCATVIFGAFGDLTKRKLIPALDNLAKDNLLSKEFALIGFARPEWTTEQFRDKCSEEIRQFATTSIDADTQRTHTLEPLAGT